MRLEKDTIYNENCIITMRERMKDNEIDLIVTSPPYYNVRDYVQYSSLEAYEKEMKEIFTEAYRVLKNYGTIIVNVSDVVGKEGKEQWTTRKFPLGAYFTVWLEEIGFVYVDDIIWDKGEPESKRHLGNPPYPHRQYPVNAYEHILVFEKNELDMNKIPCPTCESTKVLSNGRLKRGVQSWECNNPECEDRTPTGRGKRFSGRMRMFNSYQTEENKIPEDIIKKWRRDIVEIQPVFKHFKGKNIKGHSAPYPEDITDMAVLFYSGVGDIVYDMFMGSGTTGVSAKRYKRHYVGSELHKEYTEIAQQRIDAIKEE